MENQLPADGTML